MRTILLAFSLSLAAVIAGCQSTPAADSELHSSVVVLQHVGAAELAATLREFLQQDVRATGRDGRTVIAPHSASNSLLIRGSEERVAQVLKMVSQLDVPTGS